MRPTWQFEEMTHKRFSFQAHPDKGNVSAILIKPRGAHAMVVLGHGAGAGMEHSNMEQIAQRLAEMKIATLRYQFPFMERGGGRDSLEVSIATVANATLFATKQVPKLPLYAGGHSFGGRMTSHAAANGNIPAAKGLIFFAFPLHPSGKPGIERAAHLADIPQRMLFLTGTRDKLNDLKLFRPVVKKLTPLATLHELDTADHSYKVLKRTRQSEEDVFHEMARVADTWIRQS